MIKENYFFDKVKRVIFALILSLLIVLISGVEAKAAEKVHFISVNGDATLIESNGHFGLIDGGEDSENPSGKPILAGLQGTEKHLLDYLRKNAKSSDGNIYLDFVVGTHAHSDHIGGLRHVIDQPDIKIGKIYLKKYDSRYMNEGNLSWDNQEEYDLLIQGVNRKKIPLLQSKNELDETIYLGNMIINLFNTKNLEYNISSEADKVDENVNSICALVHSQNNIRLFLGGDINYYPNPENLSGVEMTVANQIGKVDVAKLSHHGVIGSNSAQFLNILNPKSVVATWNGVEINSETKQDLKNLNINTYSVHENGDIILDFNSLNFGLDKYANKWVFVDGTWHYLDVTGFKHSGWLLYQNRWYFLDSNGSMKNGWQYIHNGWYYMNKNGEMKTDWQLINNNWYFMDSNGLMKTDWLYKNSRWYLLNNSGAMLKGWANKGGQWYFLNADGSMVTGWLKTGNKWYLLDRSGKMITGTYYDGFCWQLFRSDGSYISKK